MYKLTQDERGRAMWESEVNPTEIAGRPHVAQNVISNLCTRFYRTGLLQKEQRVTDQGKLPQRNILLTTSCYARKRYRSSYRPSYNTETLDKCRFSFMHAIATLLFDLRL